jgi:dTDP-4-amino-4,6-dideoxygalactose transaminase
MIPLLDLKTQYAQLKPEIDAALADVLATTAFILGPKVTELEERVAAYCGCAHGIGVASGSDALELSLLAAGVGPGDEVITTPFTFVATANTISRCGATPVFCDIDPITFNLNPESVAGAITPATKAIVPVHLFGHPADMNPIMAMAKTHDHNAIEDSAQAMGARHRDRPVCSMGDLGCLSFYPTKNLGAYGDAGMVVTNDAELAHRVRLLARQGIHANYRAEVLGFNSRLDAMQAAILGVKLDHLNDWNAARRQGASWHAAGLAATPAIAPATIGDVEHVFHQYTIRAPRRDALRVHLRGNGIGCNIYYPEALHLQPAFAYLGHGPGAFPNADRVAGEVLSLPMFPELAREQVNQVTSAIQSFYGACA